MGGGRCTAHSADGKRLTPVACGRLQQDVPDGADPSLHGTEVVVLLPVIPQLLLPVELLAQGDEQAAVPLLGGEVLADDSEVEDGEVCPVLAQASRGAGPAWLLAVPGGPALLCG